MAPTPPKVSPFSKRLAELCVETNETLHKLASQLASAPYNRTYEEVAPDLGHASSILFSLLLYKANIRAKLAHEYLEAGYLERFLETNEWIQEALKNAWEQRKYRAILTYTFWYDIPAPSDIRRFTRGTVMNTMIQARALALAWTSGYSGRMNKIMLAIIQHVFRWGRGRPHTTYASLIQSSGFGKSRTIEELGELIFCVAFNLRLSDETTQQPMMSYPTPDIGLRDHFISASLLSHQDQMMFFWTWLLYLFEVIITYMEDHDFQPQGSYQKLARLWRESFLEDRDYVYKQAIIFQKQSGVHGRSFDELQLDVRKALGKLLDRMDRLVDDSERLKAEGQVKFVCSFDEADVLARTEVEHNRREGNLFEAFCSSLNVFRGLPIFFVFLSTNSHIALLAPPLHKITSDAAALHFDSLIPPFTEASFDCSPEFPLPPNGYTLEEISTVEFMAQFGRPLWRAVLWGAEQALREPPAPTGENRDRPSSPDPDAAAKEVLALARAKLVGRGDSPGLEASTGQQDLSDRWDDVGRRALADIRITLGYEASREKTYDDLSTMVASYMRTAYTVPKHREYMRSGYPSEPILAEAAAQELQLLKRSDRSQGPTTLPEIAAEALRHDLCSPGERGEVVGRILLTLAYEAAVERNHRVLTLSRPVNYSAGCPLIFFIEELFTEEHAKKILNSYPDNTSAKKRFREIFRDAYVRFTHFGRLGDNGGITSHLLFAAFLRSQAHMGHPTQAQIDVAIPVVMNINDICENNMTVLLVSFKRRLVEGTRTKYTICADTLGVFSYTAEHDFETRPYVALVMELGVCGRARYVIAPRLVTDPPKNQEENILEFGSPATPDPVTPKTPRKVVVLGPQKAPNMATRQKEQPEPTHHPRYNIFAYGCSEHVYKVIKESERPIYQVLLANRDLFDEHPRKRIPDSLRAVLRLKPVWYTMNESYDWISVGQALQDDIPPETDAARGFMSDSVFAGEADDILEEEAHMFAYVEEGDDESSSDSSEATKHSAQSLDGPQSTKPFFEQYPVEFPKDEGEYYESEADENNRGDVLYRWSIQQVEDLNEGSPFYIGGENLFKIDGGQFLRDLKGKTRQMVLDDKKYEGQDPPDQEMEGYLDMLSKKPKPDTRGKDESGEFL